MPIGFEDGLPLAFQIAGKPFDEAGVMRVGHAFEQATDFHRQRPAIAGISTVAALRRSRWPIPVLPIPNS